eukprot:scaffold121447_cov64-Phaeocystis_antarctica.AAC.3
MTRRKLDSISWHRAAYERRSCDRSSSVVQPTSAAHTSSLGTSPPASAARDLRTRCHWVSVWISRASAISCLCVRSGARPGCASAPVSSSAGLPSEGSSTISSTVIGAPVRRTRVLTTRPVGERSVGKSSAVSSVFSSTVMVRAGRVRSAMPAERYAAAALGRCDADRATNGRHPVWKVPGTSSSSIVARFLLSVCPSSPTHEKPAAQLSSAKSARCQQGRGKRAERLARCPASTGGSAAGARSAAAAAFASMGGSAAGARTAAAAASASTAGSAAGARTAAAAASANTGGFAATARNAAAAASASTGGGAAHARTAVAAASASMGGSAATARIAAAAASASTDVSAASARTAAASASASTGGSAASARSAAAAASASTGGSAAPARSAAAAASASTGGGAAPARSAAAATEVELEFEDGEEEPGEGLTTVIAHVVAGPRGGKRKR